MNKRRGFTLVELLVVIGVIVALISILLPAMASVRHQAKTAACLGNLRTVQLAFVNYLGNENDNRSFTYTTPSTVPTPVKPFSVTSWLPDLRNAGATDSSRICPEATDIAVLPAGGSQSGSAFQSWTLNVPSPMVNSVSYYAGSYAFNGWLYAYTPNTTLSNSLAMPTSQASYILLPKGWKPSVPLFCDSVWIETFPTSKDTYAANLQPSMTTPGMGNICINRHHRAINVVFLDGSASTTQLQDLWNLPWSTNYTPPATPVVVPLVP